MWDHLATPEAFWETPGNVSGTSRSETARMSLGGASEALGVLIGPWDSSKVAEVNMQCIRTKRKSSIAFCQVTAHQAGTTSKYPIEFVQDAFHWQSQECEYRLIGKLKSE